MVEVQKRNLIVKGERERTAKYNCVNLLSLTRLDDFVTAIRFASPPSRGGDAAVYVFGVNQPSLPTPF